MPEPQADPYLSETRRVALHALAAGVVITGLKFGVFWVTNSVAVLSDALESIINVAAAAMMLYALWLANQPADRSHPYGHGKAQYLAVGLEGWLILSSGVFIFYEAVRRLVWQNDIAMKSLVMGWWYLAGVGVLSALLAFYVLRSGRLYENPTLIADGKHLLTDVASTTAVLVGIILVHVTGWAWLDPVIALVVAGFILFVSWRLLWQSIRGLMDTSDPADDDRISGILDQEIENHKIHGYHKVRHRHSGRFHWVDMHLQVDGGLSVAQGHALASRIEGRIERALGEANATAHLEPWDPEHTTPPRNVATGALAREKREPTSNAEKHQPDDPPNLIPLAGEEEED